MQRDRYKLDIKKMSAVCLITSQLYTPEIERSGFDRIVLDLWPKFKGPIPNVIEGVLSIRMTIEMVVYLGEYV